MRIRRPWTSAGRKFDADGFWPFPNLAPPDGDTTLSVAQAAGLPAVLAVVRLLANAVAMIPLHVLRDGDNGLREKARDAWQWDLLQRRPSSESTPATFKADVAAAYLTSGNTYIRKFKDSTGRVRELIPLDPRHVTARRDNGRLVFEDGTGGTSRTRSRDEIIFARGFALDGSPTGVSPLTAARMAIVAGLRRQEFEAKHLKNGIFPGLGFKWPSNVDKATAQEWIEEIEARHKSSHNAGRLVFIGGGAELVPIPISLEDAQFAEATKLTIAQVCAMYQVPLSFFSVDKQPTENDRLFLLTFAVGPVVQAITEALNADDDLFPATDGLFAEGLVDALLKMDTKTKYDAYRLARQGGWITPNEIRAKENLAPAAGGDEIQVTPVGGAPNADVSGSKADVVEFDGVVPIDVVRTPRRQVTFTRNTNGDLTAAEVVDG